MLKIIIVILFVVSMNLSWWWFAALFVAATFDALLLGQAASARNHAHSGILANQLKILAILDNIRKDQ